ncbi:ester cyclase family protein [Streptomyces albipurpureus]|uniref:Ester cyclase n=1 Tax=Streptomyces albipurpureus TaxID=2897419 RepID=A0ABT0UHX0_9ACTN|nr:ester cyclase family protein [Streptomyces sp. CWNU-1]MCM2387220.1 ester cyclase [Streptomyces sp. CWNU-1]
MNTVTPADQRSRNTQLVRDLYQSLYREHRLDQAGTYFHPEYTEHDPLAAPGPDGPARHWRLMTGRFPELRAGIDHLVADTDRVMVFATWTGQAVTGERFRLHTAELYRIEDDRIAEHWNVVDRAVLAEHGVPGLDGDGVQPPAPGPYLPYAGTERANAELVLGAYREVFSEHRLDLAERYYHQDYRHHNVRTAAVPNGLDAFKVFFADNIAAFPDLTTTVDHLVAEGDRVMVFVTWRGTLTGAWSGGGPSGGQLTMRTCDQFRIENGKVAEHWEIVDYLALARAGLPTP